MFPSHDKGGGLGNQFLSNIREVEVILHMVRCFEDGNIVHVEMTHRLQISLARTFGFLNLPAARRVTLTVSCPCFVSVTSMCIMLSIRMDTSIFCLM